MGNIAKTELGRRVIAGCEEIANDPKQTPKARRDAAKKAAEWKAARANP